MKQVSGCRGEGAALDGGIEAGAARSLKVDTVTPGGGVIGAEGDGIKGQAQAAAGIAHTEIVFDTAADGGGGKRSGAGQAVKGDARLIDRGVGAVRAADHTVSQGETVHRIAINGKVGVVIKLHPV